MPDSYMVEEEIFFFVLIIYEHERVSLMLRSSLGGNEHIMYGLCTSFDYEYMAS